jgi:hypothetical protein
MRVKAKLKRFRSRYLYRHNANATELFEVFCSTEDNAVIRRHHNASPISTTSLPERFARDSPLEESGFELSVPLGPLPQSTCCERRIRDAAACLAG